MKKIISEYVFGDIKVCYVEENNVTGLMLLPVTPAGDISPDINLNKGAVTPLCDIYMPGGKLPGGYAAGHTMLEAPLSYAFRRVSTDAVTVDGTTTVTTILQYGEYLLYHVLTYHDGDKAISVHSQFVNISDETAFVDLLTSCAIGFLTPYNITPAQTEMTLHRMRSNWSAEGRVVSHSLDDLNMERSWSGNGIRLEKFGQLGSMPVRGWFPFAALTDDTDGVTWAMQLGASASWQIELLRHDEFLVLAAGNADYDFGHFRKTVEAGASFRTPEAYITVVKGGLDDASQRILTAFENVFEKKHPEPLPLLYNEYCTTWGDPSHENITKILPRIDGLGVDYFVIDSGWYKPENGNWWDCGGDWNISKRLFPAGLDKTVDAIHSAGMKAGIWFEAETCAPLSKPYNTPEMILHRDGVPLTVGGRRFLDTRKPCVRAFMEERITGLLKRYRFDYMKVDYNETIGMGCDTDKASHSPGEGLYDVIEASKDFYRSVKEAIPGFIIENCSSGGHRIEPSLMELTDMASFSDAHECVEIPIIAANLHRLMLPSQEQIWAVLRGSDSECRLVWSLLSACLGVMCISGDVYNLSDTQWEIVRRGIAFYRGVSDTIKHGVTSFYGTDMKKYRHPLGWQAIVRKNTRNDEIVAILHRFDGDIEDNIRIPLDGKYKIADVYTCAGNTPELTDDGSALIFRMPENRSAAGVILMPVI